LLREGKKYGEEKAKKRQRSDRKIQRKRRK
jgi:hypothetical protein